MTGICTKKLTVIMSGQSDSGRFLLSFMGFSEFSNFSTSDMFYTTKIKSQKQRGS